MPPYRRAEYDEYVEGYREAQAKQIALSGESPEFFAEYKVRKLAEWLPGFATRPAAVLDYGCGDGLMTSFVRRYFPQANVHGTDPSSKSIAIAAQHYPGIAFACTDGPALSFADRSLDMIFSSGVFHHIPVTEHHLHLDEVFRALKPEGAFVLFELNPFNPFSFFVFKKSPFDRNAKLMFPPYARRLLRGYGALTLKYCSFFPALLAPLRALEPYLSSVPLGAHYAAIVRPKATP